MGYASIPVTEKTSVFDTHIQDGQIDEVEFAAMPLKIATASIVDSFKGKDVPSSRADNAYQLIAAHPKKADIELQLVSKIFFDLTDRGLCERIQNENLTFDYPKDLPWPEAFGDLGPITSITVRSWETTKNHSSYMFGFQFENGEERSVSVYQDESRANYTLWHHSDSVVQTTAVENPEIQIWFNQILAYMNDQIFGQV